MFLSHLHQTGWGEGVKLGGLIHLKVTAAMHSRWLFGPTLHLC